MTRDGLKGGIIKNSFSPKGYKQHLYSKVKQENFKGKSIALKLLVLKKFKYPEEESENTFK